MASTSTRLLDTSRYRWVHHALYVATASTTALAVAAGGRALAPALVPLAVIPYAGSGRRHPIVALTAAPFYARALTRR